MIGSVALTVSDLERSRAFYTGTLGLEELGEIDGSLLLGVNGNGLLSLRGDESAPRRDRRTTGLFHFAVLVPSRADLAGALKRLSGVTLTGASDHLVSEALYLDDPDGNGIEIYRDRPRSEWPPEGQMATLPLDLDSLRSDRADPLPAGTRIGHVHLQVAELEASEHFYAEVLGFDVMLRAPGALFLSTGGYHHHIGLNTWNSRGADPPEPGSVGLRFFELHFGPAVAEVRRRVRSAGYAEVSAADGFVTADPSGNHLLIRV